MFQHEIRVRWADCDPANIAYTGRLPEFALEAIDAWWEHTVGADWYRLTNDRGIGTPFVSLSMDFRKPVTPRYRLICEVAAVALGRTSITFRVVGRQDGACVFEGRFTEVFMLDGVFKAVPPPEDIRAQIAATLSEME